ncbi:hypothetical protein Prudu_016753, partial [Prunus dulcis]
TSRPSNRSPGHHTWGRSPGPVPNEPRHDGEQPPTQRRRCRGRSRPEIAMEADDFSSVSPPNRSSKAIEVRGIHHRASHSFAPPSKVEDFGYGQITGETLPNFRQKSEENLIKERVKRSFVSDIHQVSDTHRSRLDFQSENWVGSCQVK